MPALPGCVALFQQSALDQPIASGRGDEYRTDRNVANDESRMSAEFPDQRQDQRGDRDLTDLDAEIEREQGRDRFDAGADAQFPKSRCEAEAVNEAECERQHPAAFDLAAQDVFEADIDDRSGDQWLDYARRNGDHPKRGQGQRYRMRDRERSDYFGGLPQRPARDQQRE